MSAPARTTRIVTVDNDRDGTPIPPQPGDVLCLVEWRDLHPTRPSDPRRGCHLTADPRTNLSHESLWEGWLGCTNNISEHALGAYRVVSVVEWDPTGDDLTPVPRWRASLAATDEPGAL